MGQKAARQRRLLHDPTLVAEWWELPTGLFCFLAGWLLHVLAWPIVFFGSEFVSNLEMK
jgi:hypothetical protein